MAAHLPKRPEWTCRTDGKSWPCAPAKTALRAEYAETPTSTEQAMFSHYLAALADLPDEDGDDLYRRFVNWLRVPE